ncbi:DUF2892 domain-containing protein [Spirosoma soli]|uniref:DUF2892 domain-containing protein n=1 Tax=Spirosoma soli TaxID=1770529 RepID=A0ABW5MAR0_9BACT
MNLKKNVGLVDQVVRAVLVLDLVMPCLLGFVTGPVVYLMLTLALVLSVSCLLGYCWVYDLLKISTRPTLNT